MAFTQCRCLTCLQGGTASALKSQNRTSTLPMPVELERQEDSWPTDDLFSLSPLTTPNSTPDSTPLSSPIMTPFDLPLAPTLTPTSNPASDTNFPPALALPLPKTLASNTCTTSMTSDQIPTAAQPTDHHRNHNRRKSKHSNLARKKKHL